MLAIDQHLATRFADEPVLRHYYHDLFAVFLSSGLADPHITSEIISGGNGKFWSRMWEALLYRHLSSITPEVSSAAEGPDFHVTINGTPIYVEAITPEPIGLPPEWLAPVRSGQTHVSTFPHVSMLLRWTAAIKEKRNCIAKYRRNGRVDQSVPTVIAVNSSQLSRFPDEFGITQWPFAVEATFPIGPFAAVINRESGKLERYNQSLRFSVPNHNGSPVPTDSFLNPDYECVSAVLGCARSYVDAGPIPTSLVHNPLASVPLPPGLLGATQEYVARREGDDFVLERLDVPQPA